MSTSFNVSINAPQNNTMRPLKLSEEAREKFTELRDKYFYHQKKATDFRRRALNVLHKDIQQQQQGNYNPGGMNWSKPYNPGGSYNPGGNSYSAPSAPCGPNNGQTSMSINGGGLPNININLN
jgi:hypothetical protein